MGSSKVTTGWNYRLAWHDILCKGPIDAFLEFRGADKQAWKGNQTASGAIAINKPQLWGGDKDQGGAVGTLRTMFGEAGQIPNAYLTSIFGPKTAAHRGITSVAYEGGIWGANNPFAQKRSYRVLKLVKGWDDDDCWYPETCPVPLNSTLVTTLIDPDVVLDSEDTSLDGSAGGFDFTVPPGATIEIRLGASATAWSFTPSDDYQPYNYAYRVWWNHFGVANLITPGIGGGTFWPDRYETAAEAYAAHSDDVVEIPALEGGSFRLYLRDAEVDDNRGTGSFSISYTRLGSRFAMNPAHMILFAHTQQDAGRQPRETVNLDHLTVAADWFYAQGFGLCTARVPKNESPREFVRRIEKVAGCSFSQSLDDGLYYLDIANGIYDFESLPIIADDDVLAFKETATVQDDAVNSVSVKYFDPERKESIITPPVRAMGLIGQFGEIHQTLEFPEIPIGSIAVRVATRELLGYITPTRLFELACRPTVYKLRKNQYVRLQLPKRGIADMVCLVGDIREGGLASGAFQLKLGQDIYSLPSTVYTEVELGEDPSPPSEPAAVLAQRVIEAPYINLAAALPAAELAALPADAGYVIGMAADPGSMRDFTMLVAPEGGSYEAVADGQFSPTAVADRDVLPGEKLAIPFNSGQRLAGVQVGDLMLWVNPTLGDELCRVDAIDLEAETLGLGRGCGDTVPKLHLAGSRMFFYQATAAYDTTQYIAGESIDVKLVSNSWSEQQDPADVAAVNLTFARRADRPLPPANLKIDGVSIFDLGTPGGGGSGGGGGGGGLGGAPGEDRYLIYTPDSLPASRSVGPNGGFPDPQNFPYPPPAVFGSNVIPNGDFADAGDLAEWTLRDWTALPALTWTIDTGKLRYQGDPNADGGYRSTIAARNANFTMGAAPFPIYRAHVSAKARTLTPSTKAQVGVIVAGTGVGEFLSTPVEVSSEQTITFEMDMPFAALSGGVRLQYPSVRPIIKITTDEGTSAICTLDDASLEFEDIAPAFTEIFPTGIDLTGGDTDWDSWPVDPYAPTYAFSGGTLTVTVGDGYIPAKYFALKEAISGFDTPGQYIRIEAEVWSNDEIDSFHWTFGGVMLGLAKKTAAGYQVLSSGLWRRGDFTLSTAWLRLYDAPEVGETWHILIGLRGHAAKVAKVRAVRAFRSGVID